MGVEHRRREASMKLGAVRPELAHRPEDRDPPLGLLFAAEALEGRRHRGRIGIVALVDQQRLAAGELERMALAAALEARHVGEREPGRRDVGAQRLDRCQHGKRVGHPMLAALRDGEGQLTLQKRRADQTGAALRDHGMHRVDVGIAAAEGDDLLCMPPRGLHQAVAMGRVVG